MSETKRGGVMELELSVVGMSRIVEYQEALARRDPDEIADAEEKLLALDIDPAIARTTRIDLSEIEGDR